MGKEYLRRREFDAKPYSGDLYRSRADGFYQWDSLRIVPRVEITT